MKLVQNGLVVVGRNNYLSLVSLALGKVKELDKRHGHKVDLGKDEKIPSGAF